MKGINEAKEELARAIDEGATESLAKMSTEKRDLLVECVWYEFSNCSFPDGTRMKQVRALLDDLEYRDVFLGERR